MIEIILDVLYIGILITVSYTDLRWRRIPNAVILPGILIAFLAATFRSELPAALLGGFVGAVFFAIPTVIFGPERAGMGDVKLALFMGLAVYFPAILYTLALASVSALVVIFPGIVFRGWTRETVIPFGPFLALGALVSLAQKLV
jgi:prepilin signal peptidase PulO-like enzyme (type II secretory pathway)